MKKNNKNIGALMRIKYYHDRNLAMFQKEALTMLSKDGANEEIIKATVSLVYTSFSNKFRFYRLKKSKKPSIRL